MATRESLVEDPFSREMVRVRYNPEQAIELPCTGDAYDPPQGNTLRVIRYPRCFVQETGGWKRYPTFWIIRRAGFHVSRILTVSEEGELQVLESKNGQPDLVLETRIRDQERVRVEIITADEEE